MNSNITNLLAPCIGHRFDDSESSALIRKRRRQVADAMVAIIKKVSTYDSSGCMYTCIRIYFFYFTFSM